MDRNNKSNTPSMKSICAEISQTRKSCVYRGKNGDDIQTSMIVFTHENDIIFNSSVTNILPIATIKRVSTMENDKHAADFHNKLGLCCTTKAAIEKL
mmetsp:Transcript_2719/g.4220  ORF Transcript_2719/g.4220 Transcript_2719/m.4220 type:complete len:97 (+) Transcript_2719:182-472(+)